MSRILPPHPLQKLRKLIHVQVIEQQSHDCTQRFPQLVKSFFKILCAYSPIKDADSFYEGYAILNVNPTFAMSQPFHARPTTRPSQTRARDRGRRGATWRYLYRDQKAIPKVGTKLFFLSVWYIKSGRTKRSHMCIVVLPFLWTQPP